jgi:predicted PurR-regulated permease PerM
VLRSLEDNALLVLVIVVSLLFAWILWPFFGAVVWAAVLAIVFAPLHRRLLTRMPDQHNLAGLVTLLVISAVVILPLTLTVAALAEEATGVHLKIQSGDLDFGRFFQDMIDALPGWATDLLHRFNVTDFSSIKGKLGTAFMQGSSYFATQALNIGWGTLNFIASLSVMLYLLYFFVRDGDIISERITHAIPLPAEQREALIDRSTVVIRAMVKGNLLVAIVQGALGGLIFWFLGIRAPVLWAVVMAIVSLLPAVGSAVIWFPVAIYLLVTGAVWQGVILMAYGTFVMGLVDNLLRPLLIGKDTHMPGYLVLISTLGGIATFGLTGFIIGPVVAALFIAVWDIFSASREIKPRRARR